MPIYTYRCENCGIQFDRRQSFSDEPLKRCPECNQNTLRKVYQPVGIVFKGSGFYSTDNRSPSGSRSSHKSKGDNGNNGSAKSDGKSATADSGKTD